MAAPSSIVGRVLGHYRVVEQIGQGGMGVVFRAHDERLDRDVALKVLPPGILADQPARKRFRNEALALSRLSHPNVAHIYDFDTQDEIDFLVMEFVPGVTLDRKISRSRFPEEEVLRLGREIAATLDQVSQVGIIHRDLKPGNIMITPSGNAKLLDFGLAKLLKESDVTRSLDATREAVGTLPYMAPELLRGEISDFRSDIYALGAVLYEMATARRAMPGSVTAILLQDILHKTPQPPRELNTALSPGFESVILRCLAKEPIRRYQRASELRAALEAISSDHSWWPTQPSNLQVKPLRFMAVAVFVGVLILLGAVLMLRQHHASSEQRNSGHVSQLAILPLPPAAGNGDAVAFGNGLIETLTSRLSQLTTTHALEVVPASEIRAKGVSSLQQAREEFGADIGLELNVVRAAGLVRVNYSLVDAKTHRQLGGDTITAPDSDPFSAEDQVAESVVKALQIQLRPEERRRLSEYGTAEPAAYDFYLQGAGYLQEFQKPESVEDAILEFQQALQRDPNYALALAGLGEAYWREYEHTKQPGLIGKAKTACDRAIQLRPNAAAGHLCSGLLNEKTGAYEKAATEYQIAAELEPTNDSAFSGLASAYQQLGRPAEAEQTYRKAITLRPNYWATYNWLGNFYVSGGRYADAASQFSKVIALVPDSFAGYSNLGSTYVLLGEYEQAIAALQRSIEIRPTAEATSNLATAYFQLGRFSEAARTGENAVALDGNNYEVWGNLGDAYYWVPEERAKARAAYKKALDFALKRSMVNSRDPYLLIFIAEYYAMLGQQRAAAGYAHRALLMAGKNPDVLFNAALVSNQLGKTQDAMNYIEKAVSVGYSTATIRASVVRQAERRLFRERRARFTFSRMSPARAVQMKGFGLSL